MRALAAEVLHLVIDQGQSLSQALPQAQEKLGTVQQKARLQEICYGSLRYYRQLQFFANKLIDKPLKKKLRLIELLIYTGIYQLHFMRTASHAVVQETVEATVELKHPALKALVNGVLRSFQRQQAELTEALSQFPQIELSFPNWLYEKVTQLYPEQAAEILDQCNQRPPMWIRANKQKVSTTDYLAQLTESELKASLHPEATEALLLEQPTDVNKLPNFELGWSSVQDAAAQLSVNYLDAQPGDHVLDCCCAPGGKTCHILETTPELDKLVAIDLDENRLKRVSENLHRLQLSAEVKQGDAADHSSWWDGEHFDRILLDAPCSATGVIRRHPDIKWLRKKTDIAQLVELQSAILDNIWQVLKPGGRLVYATCSILADENSEQIRSFLARQPDAELAQIENNGCLDKPGRQILPGQSAMDGFYYATLIKSA